MINFDQIFSRTPYNTFTGNEVLVLQKTGITGGALLSSLKSFFKLGFLANDISNASTIGKSVLTAADLAAVKTTLEIPVLPVVPSPVNIGINTTLNATHLNKRLFVTAAVTVTFDSSVATNKDYVQLINTAATAVTLTPGAGEDFRVKGSTANVTTYSLGAGNLVRAYLLDANTWYLEV